MNLEMLLATALYDASTTNNEPAQNEQEPALAQG